MAESTEGRPGATTHNAPRKVLIFASLLYLHNQSVFAFSSPPIPFPILELYRTIMRSTAALPGRAAPKERPSPDTIQEFVDKTGGGTGSLSDDDGFFRRESAAKSNQVMHNGGGERVASGKFHWSEAAADVADPAQYIIANTGQNADNVHLLRFFSFYEWGLRRPELILTITGGAAAFDLNSDAQSKILKGMMEGARDLSPWFITGGTASGIMKYVGEARARYNPSVPLIGIVPLGVFKGCHAIKERAAGKEGTPQSYIEMKNLEAAKGIKMPAELDRNHSHFIFTDDGVTQPGPGCFGKETKLRADFEACVGANFPPHPVKNMRGQEGVIRPYLSGAPSRSMEEYILDVLRHKRIGWDQMYMKKPSAKISFRGVPVISICVQGGPGSINTVLDAARNGTPCLVVRGSGKAADLIADCVLMRFSPEHDLGLEVTARDERQKDLISFLVEHCGLDADPDSDASDVIDNPNSDNDKCYNFSGVQARLNRVVQAIKDADDSVELGKELVKADSPVPVIKEWLADYATRAGAMARNFYGQTRKETKDFVLKTKITGEHCKIICALCDRMGLFCEINAMDDGMKASLLIHSRSQDTDLARAGTSLSGSCRQPRCLDARDWSDEEMQSLRDIEDKCKEVFGIYEINLPPGSHCKNLNNALSAAMTNKCWVYELLPNDDDAPDFKASLLNCLINGVGHPSADDAEILGRKLLYAIMWQRADVLGTILDQTGLIPQHRMPVLDNALLEAMGRNEVEAVKILLDRGASVDVFEIEPLDRARETDYFLQLVKTSVSRMQNPSQEGAATDLDKHPEKNLDDRKRRASYSAWSRLIKAANNDPQAEYFKMLYADTKEEFSEVGEGFSLSGLASTCFGSLAGKVGAEKHLDRNGKTDSASEPIPYDEQKKLASILSAQIMVLKKEIDAIKKRESNNSEGSIASRYVFFLFRFTSILHRVTSLTCATISV